MTHKQVRLLPHGEDPALCYCRICGRQAVPPYPGFYRDAVCSRECFTEWTWRDTLHTLRKKYYENASDINI